MIDASPQPGNGLDRDGPAALRTGLLGTLATACLADRDNIWDGVARMACALLNASTAGVVLGIDRRLAGCSGGPVQTSGPDCGDIAAALRTAPRGAMVIPSSDANRAAAAIGDDPDIGFIWVARQGAPFHWREAENLRGLAQLATLLEAIDGRREDAEQRLGEWQMRSGAAPNPSLISSIDFAERLRRLSRVLNDQFTGRRIRIEVALDRAVEGFNERRCRSALLAAKELLTGAIKRAFGDGMGNVRIVLGGTAERLRVTVDHEESARNRDDNASGLDRLIHALADTNGARWSPVSDGRKRSIEIPLSCQP